MTEYIERDAAIKIAEKYGTCNGSVLGRHSGVADCIASMIAGLPGADVAPVVHGRWLKHYRSGVTVAEGYVSSCCDMWNERETHYCPHCGAKMDGGVDDAAD